MVCVVCVVRIIKDTASQSWRVPSVVCVVWCGVVWCGVVWCGVVWCGVVWCGVVVVVVVVVVLSHCNERMFIHDAARMHY